MVKVECRIDIFSGTKLRTFLHTQKCTASEPWFNEAEVIVMVVRWYPKAIPSNYFGYFLFLSIQSV